MDDTITGFVHLDKIAAEIGDEAGTCDADYAFQRAAAQMIYDLRNALEQAETRAEKAEAEVARLTAENACLRKLITAQDRLASCDYMTNFLVLVSAGRGLFDPTKSSKLAAQRVEYDLANADVEAARKAVAGEGK